MKNVIIYIAWMVIMSVMVIAGTQDDIYNNLVFYQKPQYNTSHYDVPINDRNGSYPVQSSMSYTSSSMGNNAIYMSGNAADNNQCTTYNEIMTTKNKTICYWHNRTNEGTDNDYSMTQYDTSNADGDWAIFNYQTDNKTKPVLYSSPDDLSIDYIEGSQFTGTWNFNCMRITYNGTQHMSFFVNNTEVGNNIAASADVYEPNSGLTIGDRCSHHPVTDYTGGLRQIMIINYSLTATEIEWLYDYTKDGSELVPEQAEGGDVTDPTVIATSINRSSAPRNSVIGTSANFSDETELDWIYFAHNNSGVMTNISYVEVPAGTTIYNHTGNFTLTQYQNDTVGVIYTANDTSGNSVQTSALTVTVPDIIGRTLYVKFNGSEGTYTSARYGDDVFVYASISFESDGLDWCLIKHNESGSYVNHTEQLDNTIADNCNYTHTVSVTRGNVINFAVEWNDTFGNRYENDTNLIIIDNTPPTCTQGTINNTSPYTDDYINQTGCTYLDVDGDPQQTSMYRWYRNQTGISYCSDVVAGAGCYVFDDETSCNDAAGGELCEWTFYDTPYLDLGNSSHGNKHDTINASELVYDGYDYASSYVYVELYATILNTAPNSTNIVNVSGQRYMTNITINWTVSEDADSDRLLYKVFRNSSIIGSPTLVSSGTSTSYYTQVPDGTYYYFINVSDGDTEVMGDIWHFTLDSTKPFEKINNISNNTHTNRDLLFFVLINDTSPYNITYRLDNGSQEIVSTHFNASPDDNELGIYIPVDTSQGEGNYTLMVNYTDSHSLAIDKDAFKKGKKGESGLIFNDTEASQEISMSLRFVEKGDKDTDTPGDLEIYSEYDSRGFVVFGANFTVIKPETKLVFGVNSSDLMTIIDSDYKGHMITGKYGLDFEGDLYVDGELMRYTVAMTRIDDHVMEVMIQPNQSLAQGQVVSYHSKSLFGLNKIDKYYTIIVDKTAPIIHTLLPINDTLQNTTYDQKFGFNASDMYADTAELYANFTGNWLKNLSISIWTSDMYNYFANHTLDNGTYIYNVRALDDAGNIGWYGHNYTLNVDVTSTVVQAEEEEDVDDGGGGGGGGSNYIDETPLAISINQTESNHTLQLAKILDDAAGIIEVFKDDARKGVTILLLVLVAIGGMFMIMGFSVIGAIKKRIR